MAPLPRFELESSDRKSGMIDRATPQGQMKMVGPPGLEPGINAFQKHFCHVRALSFMDDFY